MTTDAFRKLALVYPETTEEPHFEKTSFRVRKKIFATMNVDDQRICVKLSEQDQDLFSLADPSIIYPVPNKWGKLGWTNIELQKVKRHLMIDALKSAYNQVAPKQFSEGGGARRPT